MNKLKLSLLLIAFGLAALLFYEREGSLFLERIQLYFENGNLKTIKPRFTKEQILNNARSLLVNENALKIKPPVTKLLPLLLFEVKYKGDDDKPKEGFWLWDSFQGELILSLNPFNMTHGFQDALSANASEDEFHLLKILATKGPQSKDQLTKLLKVSKEILDKNLMAAEKKQLVLLKGPFVKLHLEAPKLELPSSLTLPAFVLLAYSQADIITQRFSKNEAIYALETAFGPHLKIRSSREVFLPIFEIDVEKKDGSHILHHFNSLTGELFEKSLHL